ncbi:hypothetical protein BU69_21350 [Escherichia coli]|nr:hypothetical protein [Escherichia coli]KJL99841.1 hypothetical protein SS50_16045 [Enterobacter chengduensis]PNL52734.1 hypothetical protein CEP65_007715 [Enterobacter hormaechei]HBY6669557.1 hypothetical protein [Klebsiella pneumoniae]EFN8291870.1 hypothetical protein [Escherichia coli]
MRKGIFIAHVKSVDQKHDLAQTFTKDVYCNYTVGLSAVTTVGKVIGMVGDHIQNLPFYVF